MSAVFAVLLSLSAAAQAEESSTAGCLEEYAKLRKAYFSVSGQLTVISSDASGLAPYLLLHTSQNGRSYSFWEHLNGEIRGYALRDGEGFDFHGRGTVEELNWHPTLIWDKLLDKNTSFKDYVCVLTGRARLAGHKVSLLRLAPQDGLRYGYLIAKDDDSSLPVEISVLDPQSGAVAKLLAVETRHIVDLKFPADEQMFDRFAAGGPSRSTAPLWAELYVPRPFEMTASGSMQLGGEQVRFQEFSDGLTSFRVYRAPKTTVMYPALNNGTITVLRRMAADFEYAVVGEVPLRFAELVLSKINPAR